MKARHGGRGPRAVSSDWRAPAPWNSRTVLVLALTAIRYLGRNPVGSETLTTEKHINIIASHAGLLPTSPPSWPSASLEALKVLANLLVLHPISRKRFARVDGPKSVAQRLRTCKLEDVERLFLLARIGFLATVERPDAVRAMMDEGIVERCAQASLPSGVSLVARTDT